MAAAINRIPAPWTLSVDGLWDGPLLPPTSAEVPQLAAQLRTQLLRLSTSLDAEFSIEGFTFRVVGQETKPRAVLLSPTGPGGQTTSADVLNAIRAKTTRYRPALQNMGYAFMIVLGGHFEAALDRYVIESALAGGQTVSMTLSATQSGYIGGFTHTMRSANTPPQLDPVVSAVAHIDASSSNRPVLTVYRSRSAAQAVEDLAGGTISQGPEFG